MRVCSHKFEYTISHSGAVSYGRKIIIGLNSVYTCVVCGKHRWRACKPYRVIQNPNPPTEKQLTLL
jgi:hypothetical protein